MLCPCFAYFSHYYDKATDQSNSGKNSLFWLTVGGYGVMQGKMEFEAAGYAASVFGKQR